MSFMHICFFFYWWHNWRPMCRHYISFLPSLHIYRPLSQIGLPDYSYMINITPGLGRVLDTSTRVQVLEKMTSTSTSTSTGF